jgi:cell wall-associated NlpC family hydrolase
VGKAAKVIPFAVVTADIAGKPYKLGGCSPSDGYDCFQIIIKYLASRGISLPSDFGKEGVTLENYPAEYSKDPERVMQLAVECFSEIMQSININAAFVGDLIVYRVKDESGVCFGIDAGNGNMLIANSEYGTILLPKRDYMIEKVLRVK